MRKIDLKLIEDTVAELLYDACVNLNEKELKALEKAKLEEKSEIGKDIIGQILENDYLACKLNLPLCQDTGQAVIFLEVGSEVIFDGNLEDAINKGIAKAYTLGYLRKSVVSNPLTRVNTGDNTPAIIHTKIVPGDKIKITAAPKGGGAENCSALKMMIPADGIEGIKKFVLETVEKAGGKPCPPILVGVGIGGNLEKAAMLAKEAIILREIDDVAEGEAERKLEQELLEAINNLGIGPMGLGGTKTALAVKVNTYPCHIASLPVAVNLQCHAMRHKVKVI
ncbi:MAG TPA: fumarate hydratase [Acholeplasma sp.]|jgi:fumarate hydratase subunit alpha|nr:fumarate hydratase [Acholeplasma sp.]